MRVLNKRTDICVIMYAYINMLNTGYNHYSQSLVTRKHPDTFAVIKCLFRN